LITGIIALRNIPIEEIPEASYPRISIITWWWGASPENVEFYVTSIIESELAQIKGVRDITSYSYDGYSYINVYFFSDTKMEFAYMRINEVLYQLEGKLPEGVDYPQIVPYMPQEYEEEEFLSVGIYSDALPTLELASLVENEIKPPITNIEGVSGVSLFGITEKVARISYDNNLLHSLGLTVTRDILPVLRNYREIYSMGEVIKGNQNHSMILKTGLSSIDEMENLAITTSDGRRFYLGELAKIQWDTSEQNQSLFRLNGNDVIQLQVYREPGSNVLSLCDQVKAELERLFATPELSLLQYQILTDNSRYVKDNLRDLVYRIAFTALIISLVLLFFFRKWRPTVIVLSTIFFEVLITLNVLYFTNQTLNYFTLCGFALAFGLLVDNAIVVYENTHKYLLRKFNYFTAVATSIKEVKWAIIAATLTTVCVFIPFIYLQEDIQVLLIPFAITVGIALISSIVVSLTFIPLCLKVFYVEEGGEWGESGTKKEAEQFPVYGKILHFFLNHRTIPIFIALVFFSYALYIFITDVDKGAYFTFRYPDYIQIAIYPPANAKLETVDEITRTFEDIIMQAPQDNLKYFQSTITPNGADIRIYFPEDVLETAYPYVLREQLVVQSKYYAGVEVRVWGLGPLFYGGGGIIYQHFELAGYNYLRLSEIAENFARTIEKNPRVTNVKIGSTWGSQIRQLNIEIKQDIISKFGVSPAEALQQLYLLLNKSQVGKITTYEDEFDIILQTAEEIDLNRLENLILNLQGKNLKLKEIADINLVNAPYRITRKNQEYLTRVEYEYRGPYRMFEEFENTILNYTHLPEGYHFVEEEEELTGFRGFIEETKQIIFILALTILIVYIILGMLFESYRQPFIIMLTLPLAFIGVSFTFAIFDLTYDSSAFIGTILLCGIVVNNAIIMVNRINQLRENSDDLNQSIIMGAKERLRPILITSFTTILGLMPFILYVPETGGSDIWSILAYATVGGLTTATFFTLFIIPVFYNLFEKMKR
jgi:HAE1 family hydrophobic/amphiphilic exporter-1